MHTIEIDFEVFKALTALRPDEHTTPNDVIRSLLKLPKANKALPLRVHDDAWTRRGVSFPSGTQFEARYKGKTYRAAVRGNQFVYNGKVFPSLSSAAIAITGTNISGWNFWRFQLPNDSRWRKANAARPENPPV